MYSETIYALVLGSLLALPLLPLLFRVALPRTPLPRGRRVRAGAEVRKQIEARPFRRLNYRHAAAVDAAVAGVLADRPHTLQLPCRECGQDSPPMPFSRSGLIPMGHQGFVITAVCLMCGGPLISRVMDEEYAAHARTLGSLDGEAAQAEMNAWLATL